MTHLTDLGRKEPTTLQGTATTSPLAVVVARLSAVLPSLHAVGSSIEGVSVAEVDSVRVITRLSEVGGEDNPKLRHRRDELK